jgi:hypothetical protein
MAICSIAAQEHLVPEAGVLAEKDEYQEMLREVFADAYTESVILRAFINVSFEPEQVVGIRKTEKGYEVFVITPSASVWETEYDRLTKGHVTTLDEHGNEVPPPKNEAYEAHKRSLPADFHHITTRTESAPISKTLVERIQHVWERMLLDARHEKNPAIVLDGAMYHFSMWIQGHGVVSGTAFPANETSRVSALTNLADTLSKYAKQELNSQKLTEALARVK